MRALAIFVLCASLPVAVTSCSLPRAPRSIRKHLSKSEIKWRAVRELPAHVEAAIETEGKSEMRVPGTKRFCYAAPDGSYRVYWFHPAEANCFWWNSVEVDSKGRLVAHHGDTFMPSERPESDQAGVAADRETGAGEPKITRAHAVETALKRLRKEAFAADIDTQRMTVHYGTFGPAGEARIRWVVDFARRGSPEITPGQWATGYLVVVDPDSGDVIEASAYKR